MSRLPVTIVLLLAAPTAVTACSGDDSPSAAPHASSTAPPPPSAPRTHEGRRPNTAPRLPTSARRVGATASVMRWRLPQPLAREVVVPGRSSGAIVAGGMVGGDSSTARTYAIDLRTGARRRLPALPIPVHDAAGVRVGTQVVIVGGGNATEQAAVQRLSTSSARWRTRRRLPRPRSDLAAVTVGGSVFVLAGYDGVASQVDILASTDGTAFRVAGRLAVGVRYPAVAVADGAVWLFGGESGGAMVDAVQRFDPGTGRTRVVARLPRPIGHAVALAVGHRILLVGGRLGPDTVTSAMWVFEPSSGRFRRAGRLPYPLADTGLVEQGQRAYLLGGETPALTDRVVRIGGLTGFLH